jgi:hypothetical protein
MIKNYKKMYEDLLAEFEQYRKESIKWSVYDFMHCQNRHRDITREEAQQLLEDMIADHDANFGINNFTVENYINNI